MKLFNFDNSSEVDVFTETKKQQQKREFSEFFAVLANKERRTHLKALKKAKKYDEIYCYYGKNIYKALTPSKVKKTEIKKLLKEGKYEDIYQKYGYTEYVKHMPTIYARDVYLETGSKTRSTFEKIKYWSFHKFFPMFLSIATLVPTTSATTLTYLSGQTIKENETAYEEQLLEYDEKISEYANEIKKLELTDFQVIMKVMSDMWDNIKGYGSPEKDIYGFYRLDFLEDNKTGVCRHMADDVAAKLNMINPDYNAKLLYVYMDSDQEYHFSNIERNVVQETDTIVTDSSSQEEENSSLSNSIIDVATSALGNHVVVALNIPGYEETFILDPTNPSLGVFKDGKLHMFSTKSGEGLTDRPLTSLVFFKSSPIDIISDYIDSFKESDKSLEELQELFGVDAQNKALEEIAKIVAASQTKSKSKSFDDLYKLDIDISAASSAPSTSSQVSSIEHEK